jgi:DUF917 family protein
MRALTHADIRAAVIGGTILGGGGGGHIDLGLELGEAALAAGPVLLASVDELPPDAVVAVCAGVGAPGAPEASLTPADFRTSLEFLNAELERRHSPAVSAVASNENGAMGTVNGWLQSATTGLPVIDCPCNGRAHPTAVMGSLGLHRDAEYASIAGFAGGPTGKFAAGVVTGTLSTTSQAMRSLSVLAGGMIAVARNPVRLDFLAERGAPGAITQAIDVGRAHANGGIEAVAALLGGRVAASGPVADFRIEQTAGFDVGHLRINDIALTFVNEYMDVVVDGETLAAFPDLIMTFDATTGEPLVSAHLASGRSVTVLTAPRQSLVLSATMDMPELMEPVKALLAGESIATG